LDGSVQEVLRKALKKRLVNPHVPSCRLNDLAGCYKIKLRQQDYRWVYTVEDDCLVVLVLAVNKREDSVVYRAAIARMTNH
jgi:mRNA interferase RelE/StbE